MQSEIILGAIVLVPLIALMALRVNATLVFLSLCLGNVLVQFVAPDANTFIDMFKKSVPKGVDASGNNIKIALLLLPVILTAVFMIRTVKGGKLILNVLPAAGVGLLGGLLIVPLLPVGVSHDIVASPLWSQVDKLQDLIVGASALVCLLVLWLQRPKTGGGGGGHEEKHAKH